MFGLPDLYQILVFAATAVWDHLNTQHEAARCTHLAVRREWRKLTPDERAGWVAGINVSADHFLSCPTNRTDSMIQVRMFEDIEVQRLVLFKFNNKHDY